MKNANMIDEKRQRITVHIVTENNRISRVSKQEICIPAMEYDLSGYTIMPGYIHTHIHLFDAFDGFNDKKLKQWLASGITYLRDEGILSRHTTKEAVNGYGGLEPLGVPNEQEEALQ